MTRIVGECRLYNLGEVLGDLELQQRSVIVGGTAFPQPRLTQWFGAQAYAYSGLRWEPVHMPRVVSELREAVEELCHDKFNSCLVNYYRDGSDCVGWHSDNEPIFGHRAAVASLSLGATRLFKLRRKSDHAEQLRFDLEHGSVLYMPPGTQDEWEHTIPRTTAHVGPRLNLTFRQTVPHA